MSKSSTRSLAASIAIVAGAAVLFFLAHRKTPAPASPPAATAAPVRPPQPALPAEKSVPNPNDILLAPAWWARPGYPISAEVTTDGHVKWQGEVMEARTFVDRVRALVGSQPPFIPPFGPGPGGRILNRSVSVLTISFGEGTPANAANRAVGNTLISELTPALEAGGLFVARTPTTTNLYTEVISVRLHLMPPVAAVGLAAARPTAPVFRGDGAAEMAAANDAVEKGDPISAYSHSLSAAGKHITENGKPSDQSALIVAYQAAAAKRDLPRLHAVMGQIEAGTTEPSTAAAMNSSRVDLEDWMRADAERALRPPTVASQPNFLLGKTYPAEDGLSIAGRTMEEVAWFSDRGGGRLGANIFDSAQVSKAPAPVSAEMPMVPERFSRGSTPTIRIELIVSREGDVLAAWPADPADLDLARPAALAVAKWKFVPALKDGLPVAVRMVLPVTFWEK